jgi:glycosyltransferase involved in cell wall biosynthesis
MLRDGKVCEDCVERAVPWPSVQHACYRGSRIQSAAVSWMVASHRWLGTWQTKVSKYIVSSKFYGRKFREGGIPAESITVKPHFVDQDPGPSKSIGNYALFVGRLAPEKGILTLLSAWRDLPLVPLRVRGEGPLEREVQQAVEASHGGMKALPRVSRERLLALIKGARFLVWPSEGYYETFGLVAIEAFACAVPVVASRSGVMEEIVADGRTGLHFNPGDPADLAAKIAWAWGHPDEMHEMGKAARREYETKYTAERNYTLLMEIYHKVSSGDQPDLRA